MCSPGGGRGGGSGDWAGSGGGRPTAAVRPGAEVSTGVPLMFEAIHSAAGAVRCAHLPAFPAPTHCQWPPRPTETARGGRPGALPPADPPAGTHRREVGAHAQGARTWVHGFPHRPTSHHPHWNLPSPAPDRGFVSR